MKFTGKPNQLKNLAKDIVEYSILAMDVHAHKTSLIYMEHMSPDSGEMLRTRTQMMEEAEKRLEVHVAIMKERYPKEIMQAAQARIQAYIEPQNNEEPT